MNTENEEEVGAWLRGAIHIATDNSSLDMDEFHRRLFKNNEMNPTLTRLQKQTFAMNTLLQMSSEDWHIRNGYILIDGKWYETSAKYHKQADGSWTKIEGNAAIRKYS